MKNILIYQTEFGRIGIAENGEAITNIYFHDAHIPLDVVSHETTLIKEAGNQLQAYFAGDLRCFNLPLAPDGTVFQQQVWTSLREISFGEVQSYGEIARSIGKPGAGRAVGQACNRNPIPIIIPCHRVVGSDGKLTGYAGGLHLKEHLIELEKKHQKI